MLVDYEDETGSGGFIELSILDHKAAWGTTQKRTMLPLVCPLFSFEWSEWCTEWLRVRRELGLEEPAVPLRCWRRSDGAPSRLATSQTSEMTDSGCDRIH